MDLGVWLCEALRFSHSMDTGSRILSSAALLAAPERLYGRLFSVPVFDNMPVGILMLFWAGMGSPGLVTTPAGLQVRDHQVYM